MTRTILAILLLLAQAAPPQPARQSGDDTGQIRGRVTDKDTGAPLPYAHVTLMEPTLKLERTAKTDDAGVFRFTGLPAGKYYGGVTGGWYRSTHDFQGLPASRPPDSIELAKGAVREINIALSRTRTIPVRVVDDFGDPLSEVFLSAFQLPAMDRVAVPIHLMTDDRGRARIPALRAGRYVVCADILGGGGSQTLKNSVRQRLMRTCYPSAANEADAEAVVVGTGPVGDIEIRMRRGGTFTISGIVLDASGAPAAGAQVEWSAFSAGRSSSGPTVRAGQDGRFRLDHVRPGAYAIEASIGGSDRPEDRRTREAAFIPIRVDSDAEDVVVTLSKGVDVPGRIVLEDPTEQLPQSQGSGFMITARLAGDFLSGTDSSIYAYSRTDRTFTLSGVFGRRTLDFRNVPAGWYVKHVRHRGDDVIDKAIDFARGDGPGSLEVVLSNRGATVTGRVLDDLANPVRAAFVWLLHADGDTVTEVATASTSANGEFRLGPLRAGEYVAVAFASRVRPLERDDRARAARLASLGERVRLTEFDERAIELRVVKEEPR